MENKNNWLILTKECLLDRLHGKKKKKEEEKKKVMNFKEKDYFLFKSS